MSTTIAVHIVHAMCRSFFPHHVVDAFCSLMGILSYLCNRSTTVAMLFELYPMLLLPSLHDAPPLCATVVHVAHCLAGCQLFWLLHMDPCCPLLALVLLTLTTHLHRSLDGLWPPCIAVPLIVQPACACCHPLLVIIVLGYFFGCAWCLWSLCCIDAFYVVCGCHSPLLHLVCGFFTLIHLACMLQVFVLASSRRSSVVGEEIWGGMSHFSCLWGYVMS